MLTIDPEYAAKGPDADLAILTLVDQALGLQTPDRLLVPPYGAAVYKPFTVGGYSATELNRQYTVVGYGLISVTVHPITNRGTVVSAR